MQYRRLFSHHSRNFHWQINVLITIVAVWGAGIILTAFFLCVPMEKNWHPMVEGTCIPIIPFYYGLQIPNIITDLLIIVVPIREVMRLQLNRKLKTGAVTMFALGIITLIFDIVRFVALLQLTAPEKMMDFTCKSQPRAFKNTCRINSRLQEAELTIIQTTSSMSPSGQRSSPQWQSSQSAFPVSALFTGASVNPHTTRMAALWSAPTLLFANSSLQPTNRTSRPQSLPVLRRRSQRRLRKLRGTGRLCRCYWNQSDRSNDSKNLMEGSVSETSFLLFFCWKPNGFRMAKTWT